MTVLVERAVSVMRPVAVIGLAALLLAGALDARIMGDDSVQEKMRKDADLSEVSFTPYALPSAAPCRAAPARSAATHRRRRLHDSRSTANPQRRRVALRDP